MYSDRWVIPQIWSSLASDGHDSLVGSWSRPSHRHRPSCLSIVSRNRRWEAERTSDTTFSFSHALPGSKFGRPDGRLHVCRDENPPQIRPVLINPHHTGALLVRKSRRAPMSLLQLLELYVYILWIGCSIISRVTKPTGSAWAIKLTGQAGGGGLDIIFFFKRAHTLVVLVVVRGSSRRITDSRQVFWGSFDETVDRKLSGFVRFFKFRKKNVAGSDTLLTSRSKPLESEEQAVTAWTCGSCHLDSIYFFYYYYLPIELLFLPIYFLSCYCWWNKVGCVRARGEPSFLLLFGYFTCCLLRLIHVCVHQSASVQSWRGYPP